MKCACRFVHAHFNFALLREFYGVFSGISRESRRGILWYIEGEPGAGEMCMSGLCMHAQKFVHVTCTFQFCPIEEILLGILYIQKQILSQNMPSHAALSPTPTMATTL